MSVTPPYPLNVVSSLFQAKTRPTAVSSDPFSMDLSKVEARIITSARNRAGDLYVAAAMRRFNCTEGEVTTDMRRVAKVLLYGEIYGIPDGVL